jgi:hypothetical protein
VPLQRRWGHSGDDDVSLPQLFPLANSGEPHVGLVTPYQALHTSLLVEPIVHVLVATIDWSRRLNPLGLCSNSSHQ